MTEATELASAAGEVDVLVNNAGIYPFASTADQTREGFEELLAVNVLAPFHLTAALAPAMVAKGAGAIVNVSTVAAVSPVYNAAAYGATRDFVDHLEHHPLRPGADSDEWQTEVGWPILASTRSVPMNDFLA